MTNFHSNCLQIPTRLVWEVNRSKLVIEIRLFANAQGLWGPGRAVKEIVQILVKTPLGSDSYMPSAVVECTRTKLKR